MTTAQITDAQSTDADILTPTTRRTARRARFWLAGILAIVLIGVVALLAQAGASGSAEELDPESATPRGALAVAEVLRDQGVEVVLASSLESAADAVRAAPSATVLLHDRDAILETEQRARLLELDARLVLLAPGLVAVQDLAPAVGAAGRAVSADAPLDASCPVPAATRAGTISAEGFGYRILDPAAGAVGCFPAGDGVFGLVEVPSGARGLAILGPAELLANGVIASEGNAALALNLLGEDATLVWYVPGIDDLRAADRLPTILELTANWVTPLSLLAILVIVAAGVWRGRRFGPLVVERLPVVVRASETMEGRARLYERAGSRLHALDALRMAAAGRLASRLGLPRSAEIAEVIAAAAVLTGRDRAGLERLLLTADPRSDAELMRLSDELALLEAEVADDARPTDPDPTPDPTPRE